MRAFFVLLLAAQPNPHVTAPTLHAAAQVCADRGYSFVAHVAGRKWLCLYSNLLNEPEAVAVASVLLNSGAN